MNSTHFPVHVAIIMDGNGRWALSRGRRRTYGHYIGSKVVDKITEAAAKVGIRYLTLYTFSTENWKRPSSEVRFLMSLLNTHLKKERELLMKNNIRFKTVGEIDAFPEKTRSLIRELEKQTSRNTGMVLSLALNYGSKLELTRACREIARKAKNGSLDPERINENTVEEHLFTAGMPDVDLLIRTGGEKRISNFMLWQSSYAEFVFFDKYWPEFTEKDLLDAIDEFKHRKRRFGGL